MTLAQFYALVDEKFPDNVSAKISSADIRDALKGIGYQLYNDVSEKSTGWTPITSIVADGERRVVKIVDWVGGDNAKPAINVYVGAAGFTAIIADAIDVRGELGPSGWTPIYAIVDDGLRKVIKVTDWIDGVGTKPAINVYLGATGYTATLANAIDIRGNPGTSWYSGTSAPVAGTGNNGDYHLHTATGDVSYKSAGTWSVVANLKGPAGSISAGSLPQSDGWDTDLLVAQAAGGTLIKTQSLRVLGVAPSSSLEQPFSPTRLRIGLGSELVSVFFGGKLSNLMAFGIARGLFPAPTVALTGTATIANTTALTDDGDNVDAIFAGGVSGGTVQITYSFTTPLPLYNLAFYRFFHVARYPYTNEVSNLKVEWQTSASGFPFRTVYDGVHVLKQGMFEIPATNEPDFPLKGLRVTYTIAANQTVRLMELGIAHQRLPFGRGVLAELHRTNVFSGSNTFNGETIVKRITAGGSAPTAATGTGAGTGGTVSIAAGSTDIAGTITLNIGTSPPTTQTIVTITFASAMAAAPKAIVISARNNQAGMSIGRFFVATKSASAWTLSSTDVALGASTTYILDYIIIA